MEKNTNYYCGIKYAVHPAFLKHKKIKNELVLLMKFPSLKNLQRRKDLALEHECGKEIFNFESIDKLYEVVEDGSYTIL